MQRNDKTIDMLLQYTFYGQEYSKCMFPRKRIYNSIDIPFFQHCHRIVTRPIIIFPSFDLAERIPFSKFQNRSLFSPNDVFCSKYRKANVTIQLNPGKTRAHCKSHTGITPHHAMTMQEKRITMLPSFLLTQRWHLT